MWDSLDTVFGHFSRAQGLASWGDCSVRATLEHLLFPQCTVCSQASVGLRLGPLPEVLSHCHLSQWQSTHISRPCSPSVLPWSVYPTVPTCLSISSCSSYMATYLSGFISVCSQCIPWGHIFSFFFMCLKSVHSVPAAWRCSINICWMSKWIDEYVSWLSTCLNLKFWWSKFFLGNWVSLYL